MAKKEAGKEIITEVQDARKAFVSQMTNALNKAETIIVGADCEVMYSGRAETLLPRGERIIMIKGDGTLLIHQPQGNAPVNYMKEKSSHQFLFDKDRLYLKSQNKFLQEYIDVLITKIHFAQTAKLTDDQKIQLTGNEKDMADMIAKNPGIIEDGLFFVGQEEQTKYGFVDVLCCDKNNNLVVIECKRYKADFQAVSQLRRYVERIKKLRGIDRVRGIIAAPSITPNAANMLHDFGFSFSCIEAPKYRERLKKSQKRLGEF